MDIKSKFIELTSRTYPHGQEHHLFDILPQNLDMDEFGNLFIKIGDSDVMFTSHLDTATSANVEVIHEFDGDIIKTNGKSILGADDKAGVVVMLHMIENNVPGLYYFFLGEEVGCVGSRKVSAKHKEEKLPYINKVISFDRRATGSVITYQGGQRCASEEFAKALSESLNAVDSTFKYSPDPTGIYTDSAQFVSIYPECTNISVGYYNEHTFSERQDIAHLIKLAEACTKIDWVALPVSRDPAKTEYRGYGGYGCGDWDDYCGSWGGMDDSVNHRASRVTSSNHSSSVGSSYSPGRVTYPALPAVAPKTVSFYDDEYGYDSSMTVDSRTLEVIKVNLSPDRIRHEETLIYDLLVRLDLEFDDMHWDGNKLTIKYDDKEPMYSNREELREYLEDLDIRQSVLGIGAF